MSGNGFTYSEAKLSDRLGISRTDIKAIREGSLTAESDWKKIGGEVALTSGGVKRLWRALETRPAGFDLSLCLVSRSAKKNGAVIAPILLGSAAMPIPVEMVVTRICLNTALVQAQQSSGLDRRTQIVWVGRNGNYVVGMRIQVSPKKNTAGVWEMAGPVPQRPWPAHQWNRLQEQHTKD